MSVGLSGALCRQPRPSGNRGAGTYASSLTERRHASRIARTIAFTILTCQRGLVHWRRSSRRGPAAGGRGLQIDLPNSRFSRGWPETRASQGRLKHGLTEQSQPRPGTHELRGPPDARCSSLRRYDKHDSKPRFVLLPPRGSWRNRQLARSRARPALSRARRRPRTGGRARLCTAEAA